MRYEKITGIARQMSVVLSRRVSQAVGLWGEPGIGKTHTVQQILREIPCQSLSLHATAPEADIVRTLPRPKKIPAWAETQLERIKRGEQNEARVLVGTFAATLAGLAPFVLHFEDLHEASPERLELIVALARAVMRTKGVGLLVTSRAELPEPFLNHQLQPLIPQETTALLKQEMGADLPEEGLNWIQGRTRGNPLFTLEFARYLTRQGFLWSDGQRWNWRTPHEGFVPVTVEALISQLVAGFAANPDVRSVLEARSILSSTVSDDIWAIVAAVERATFDQARAALEQAGIVHDNQFVHPLIAEVVANDLSPQRRREYARRAIGLLETHDPGLAVTLAELGGLSRYETLDLLHRAIERSRQDGMTLLTGQLLGLAAEHSSGEERAQLALEAEKLLQQKGSQPQLARLARMALEAQPENREARYRLALALAVMGMDEEVKTLIAELPESERSEVRWVDTVFRAQAQSTRSIEALQTLRAHPDLLTILRNVTHAAHIYTNLNDFQSAEDLIDQAFEFPDLPVRAQSNLAGLLAFIRSEQGQLEEAQRLHDQGLALALQDADLNNLAGSYYNRSFNQCRLGRYREAMDDLERAIELYDRVGVVEYSTNTRTVLGAVMARLGQFNRAETILLEAHDTFWQLGVTHGLANCEWELALLYAEWRPPHGGALALKFSRNAVEHSRVLRNERCLLSALIVAARMEAWKGDPIQAMALVQEAINLGSPSLEDAYWCDGALAVALEANGHIAEALECWDVAIHRTQNPEYQHEGELELARIRNDRQRGLTLLGWFEQRGLGSLGLRAQRYFPNAQAALDRPPILGARLEVLGAMHLSRDDQPVTYRGRKRTEILAFLLEARIAGQLEVAALELVDALYPGEPETEARNTLKQQVYLIRSSLGPESVISTPNGYALGAVSSDAEDFLQTGDSSLWRGVYLVGLGEGWRSGVHEALTLALCSRIESLLQTDHHEAARLGQILCEMEPYDPAALHLAVHALETSGNDRAAHRLYLDGRARLLEVGESLPASLGEFRLISA